MPVASKASGLQGNSQRSAGCDRDRDCDDARTDATIQPDTATTTPIECTLPTIIADYEQIDAYLTEIGAPDEIGEALDRITCLAQYAQGIQSAIRQLQQAVQKQAQPAPSAAPANNQSYAAVARKGAAQPPKHKPVPTRHRREIIVVRGNESNTQKDRSYQEIIEQLNKKGVAGVAVAVRWLPSGDIVLAMDSEQACMSCFANQSWLSTFGIGARVKKREFAVIAHGIRVNQVQGQPIEQIYKQNPKSRGSVEIL
jgi:hypothetical protein